MAWSLRHFSGSVSFSVISLMPVSFPGRGSRVPAIPKPKPFSSLHPSSPQHSPTGCPACSSLAWERWIQENPSPTTLPGLVPTSLPSGGSHIPGDGPLWSPAVVGLVAAGHQAPLAWRRPPSARPGWRCCCSGSMGMQGQGVPITGHGAGSARGGTSPPHCMGDLAGPPWWQGGHPDPRARGCRRG